MKITIIAGARPNFMKIAPIIHAIHKAQLLEADISYQLVHTGQHYDKIMSGDFFSQLGIPEPEVNLAAGGGTQAEQTAAIMVGFEKYLAKNPSDLVIVVGDVTSTLACSIVARKMNIAVAHIEGGIRSGDMTMPEEINRIVTDSISNYFFTTTTAANNNLINEGKDKSQLFWVGNTMIDTLMAQMPNFRKPVFWDKLELVPGKYIVMTLHRPSNVDDSAQLKALIQAIENNCDGVPVIFPVHPRTLKNLKHFDITTKQIKLVEPQGYLEFNYLVKNALGVITDSGGITEETTVMGVPCITLRTSTERPETVTIGTNELIGSNPESLPPYLKKMIAGEWKKGGIPELWDGKTADRIVSILLNGIER